MIDPEDDELARLAQAGDAQAFGRLIDRYWPRVYRWLLGLTHSPQLSEDVAQDSFLKAWKGISAFTPGTSFRAWVFRIARNGLIDQQRRERPTSQVDVWDEQHATEPEALTHLIQDETRRLIEEACGRLPASVREAFLLRTQEGLSFAEIAEALESTEETVRWRVHKARQLLLKELGPYLSLPSQQGRVGR
jgi:RNA polymerase sigma-70 factor (ECF subfamily)